MVIAGIGLGMMMQIFVLSVQNAVSRSAMGIGDGADAVLTLDRRDARRGADGRDREPAPPGEHPHGGHRRSTALPQAGRGGARERDHPRVPVRRWGLRHRLP